MTARKRGRYRTLRVDWNLKAGFIHINRNICAPVNRREVSAPGCHSTLRSRTRTSRTSVEQRSNQSKPVRMKERMKSGGGKMKLVRSEEEKGNEEENEEEEDDLSSTKKKKKICVWDILSNSTVSQYLSSFFSYSSNYLGDCFLLLLK